MSLAIRGMTDIGITRCRLTKAKKGVSLMTTSHLLAHFCCICVSTLVGKCDYKMLTVESRYNGPASNGNPPITEAIIKSLE